MGWGTIDTDIIDNGLTEEREIVWSDVAEIYRVSNIYYVQTRSSFKDK